MTIADTQLYRYSLPLAESLSVGGHTLTERHGLLLRVEAEGGEEGWGEAAPLPGFSPESLADAQVAARQLAAALSDADLPDPGVNDTLREVLSAANLPPSVRFAGESALLECGAAACGFSVPHVFESKADTVALNALIRTSEADLRAEAERIRTAGYRAVKLKVGRADVDTDVARVRTLRAALGEDVALRLDANRAWTEEEAVAFADALGGAALDYVEEPLRAPSKLAAFVESTGLPVALDETTREVEPADVPDSLPVRAVVLKPTLLGGLAEVRRWGRWARARGAKPVVSASYESGVGHRMLVALSASLSDAPAGLSTYARLDADVLAPRLSLDGTDVNVKEVYASEVDRSMLAPVEASH